MTGHLLEINNLNKSYFASAGTRQIILEGVNFKIRSDAAGSFTTLLAPLGAGKTTLLKAISGLESFEGEVLLNGSKVTEATGEIIYIPEKCLSFPWLNVKDNIELPIKSTRKISTSYPGISEMIELVGLSGYEDYYASSLHTGFRLRIAIARAVSVNPKIILLDDVFKNLDGETRAELIVVLNNIVRIKKIAFILATTNISDAIQLSQRILLMGKNPGKIFKEIDIPSIQAPNQSEIITKLRSDIEESLKSQNMLNSVLVTL